MSKNSFKVLRPGINTTFQDLGRDNLYHVGLPFSGAIDKRNFLIANSLITNKEDDAVLEFAYQGPLLEFSGSQTSIVITGNVNFKIIKKNLKKISYTNFNFRVNISKQKYIRMIRERYISCLLNMSSKEINLGISEIKLKYKNQIKFTDTLKCISYRK